ncbi:MAG: hypothetical protein R2769_12930 [Saprospiraceae bacterium]
MYFLDDTDITDLPMYKRAQKGIGYLPQEPSVFRKLTVENNIKAVLEMTDLSREEQKDKLESRLTSSACIKYATVVVIRFRRRKETY